MRIADNWKDYELIDCSDGEKLERWGDVILSDLTLKLFGIQSVHTHYGEKLTQDISVATRVVVSGRFLERYQSNGL